MRAFKLSGKSEPELERIYKRHRYRQVPDTEVLTMWQQSSPEILDLRRGVRKQIEQLLRVSYMRLLALHNACGAVLPAIGLPRSGRKRETGLF